MSNTNNESIWNVPSLATDPTAFRQDLGKRFENYLTRQSAKYNRQDCLQIDLHCHDLNSDVPDELWGRILRLPETWLKTNKLVKLLKENGSDLVTITNHNNARSCWQLIEQGIDVLVAAEFTCYFPEYELYIHVLTYGFTKEQEQILNEKRQNIYDFTRYAAVNDIPLIVPHPLYFYTRNNKIDVSLFEKMAIMFERFEVLNGQRDLWQSVLTLNWVESLTADKIKSYARKYNLDPKEFGVDPNKPKVLTGGSDDHTGIFAGQCGSYLYVENLNEKLKTQKPSELALFAIKQGHISPFGLIKENEKLKISLLDYFSQVATNIKDPGLLRILLHRGSAFDKVGCFALSNLLLEMQKNKKTMKFFEYIHEALQGKKPSLLVKWKISKNYRFCIEYLERIAESKKGDPALFVDTVNTVMQELFTFLNKLVIQKVQEYYQKQEALNLQNLTTEELTRKFEMPSQLTALFFGDGKNQDNISNVNINQILDGLSFPVLISLILAGASLASTRVLYQNRALLNEFSSYLGDKNSHQKRALYLTDTLRDKNGVSNSLSGKLAEIQRADLPVDFLICHDSVLSERNLHVVKPLTTFEVPRYGEQAIRIPDLLEVAKIFYQGGYDRIICSTEGPMALVALFLQQMFNVKSYFFMHTDWMDFIKHTTNLNQYERDRVRRLLRALYNRFDGIFVLNSEHKDWLTSFEMEQASDKVWLTAHHAKPRNYAVHSVNKSTLFPDATQDTPILFVACRISREKGLFDLPDIINKARQSIPDLRIVIAGSGPETKELKAALPDALFLGWQSKEQLTQLYLSLDLFIFPSRFDTFGNVLLEAFTHGMPALAYNCKGPKDIIEHNKNGFLVNNIEEMASSIIDYFDDEHLQNSMKRQALARSKQYQAEPIMADFLTKVGLVLPETYGNLHKESSNKSHTETFNQAVIEKTVA